MFQPVVGISSHGYQTQLRIAAACRLLRQDMPIALAARECGFADQAHLTHVFKRYAVATPKQYQRNILQDSAGPAPAE
jgi:AraC-like DNA-binding protein